MELVAKKYKQTDVGIIPIDWDVKRLLDVSDFYNGKAHEQSIDEAGDFVVVNSKFISTEGEIFKNSNHAISPLAKGDITLVMSDIPNGKALAKCYLIEIDNKYTLNQRICSIKTRVCDNVFLFYVLNRNKYFLSFDSGSGQTNLRRNEVLDCPLALPPTIAEQTAIATALSDIDEFISQTEKLIDKKKAIKQGVMQELLKPKEGWVTKKLGKIVSTIKSGGTPLTSRNDYYNGQIPFLSIGDMTSQGKYLNSTTSTISNQGLENSSSWLVPKNSLIYSMYASVGFVSINKIDLSISQAVLGMQFKEDVSIDFMYYSLLSMQKSVLKFVGEGTQKNLNARTVKGFDIYLPDFKEQVRVADILTDIDSNILIIESKLQKLKLQKQGMMQALLTGKIRLL